MCGGEIRLADAEIDDVLAFGSQTAGARQHLKSGFGAEFGQVGGEFGHGVGPPML